MQITAMNVNSASQLHRDTLVVSIHLKYSPNTHQDTSFSLLMSTDVALSYHSYVGQHKKQSYIIINWLEYAAERERKVWKERLEFVYDQLLQKFNVQREVKTIGSAGSSCTPIPSR